MYDIIIVNKHINIKKVIALIIVLVLLIILTIFTAITFAEKGKSREYAKEVEIQKEEIEKKEQEEKAKKIAEAKELQSRIDKTSKPLTEEQMNGILHVYNDVGEKRVFLTFDDGPTSLITPLILDTLKKEQVKASFFVLGTNVARNPNLIKREFNEGHYIGNHGYSHKYAEIYATPEAVLAEYNQTEQIIRDVLSNQSFRTNVFRFPGGSNGGKYNLKKQDAKALLKQNGIVHLDWNALTEDSAGKYTKEQLLENAKNTIGSKNSVVILMHDSADKILTSDMLPDLIHYLKENGYKFENIYDLL